MAAQRNDISVEKVLAQFQKEEASTAHRKGTFKIDASYDKALDTILKVKTLPKKRSK